MKNYRIAFVKQEIYQDLYVVGQSEKDPASILLSSSGRVGPIGLFTELHADFYIIKEHSALETSLYKRVIPHLANHLYILKTKTVNNLPGMEFHIPGSDHANGDFSIDAESVNWGEYNIVISINISLPSQIIRKYPKTLFAYMIGEANVFSDKPRFGYDIVLNQMARGFEHANMGVVDFPYTFLKGDTLSNIMMKHLNRESKRKGVYMEINSTNERPVRTIPAHFRPIVDMGQEVILHKQKISENLEALYDSKYFVKMGGRITRGNGAVEAISCGCLVIMREEDIIHKEILLKELVVNNMEDVVNIINRLENDDKEYFRLLNKQQEIVSNLFFEKPWKSIISCLTSAKKRRKYSFWDRMNDRILIKDPSDTSTFDKIIWSINKKIN